MPDIMSAVSSGWGLFPTVFGLPSYFVFSLLAMGAGTVWFFLGARQSGFAMEPSAIVLVSALFGAAVGAKLPVLLLYWGETPDLLLTGKTMLGGAAGALLAVLLAKRLFRIRQQYGAVAAPAAALALAIGRIGCLGAGCCYGKPVPFGIDLGDGIARWPTQLFEIAFHLLAFLLLLLISRGGKVRGFLLPGYLGAYLVFRYATEFLREGAPVFAGQTVYQLFCICGLLLLAAWVFYPPARRAGNRFR